MKNNFKFIGLRDLLIDKDNLYLSVVLKDTNENYTISILNAKLNYNKFLLHLTNELKLYRKGAKILYGFPRISYWVMRLGLGKKFMNGYSEGKTLSEIMGKKSIFAN